MLADRLAKSWETRRGSIAIDPLMQFSAEGLVLGAKTVLAPCGESSRDISVDPFAPRLRALLTAAHSRQPVQASLIHLRKAADCWRQGDDAYAAMHLALSGLDRLEQPESDAHRLFLADALLKSGVGADAIIAAVGEGPSALDRLHKYDPDQPRVPSGSGRTSGQWTTGGGSASGSQLSEPRVSLRPGVNPSTIPEIQVGSVGACEKAHLDCVDAAVYASRNDAANDNRRFVDLKNCREAEWACDTLSWVIEDLPLPSRGGVIFPHGGVVVIEKGFPDRYYPPFPNGKPRITRNMGNFGEDTLRKTMNAGGYPCPPWNVVPDETISSDPVEFTTCSAVISALAARLNGKVTGQTYSRSRQWGKIVRAKIVYEHEGRAGSVLVTCWSDSASDVKIALQVEGCCGQP